jgi:hypothetical protein
VLFFFFRHSRNIQVIAAVYAEEMFSKGDSKRKNNDEILDQANEAAN